MKRITRFLGANVIRRHLPHGLVHWRYIFPNQPQPIRIHRNLWRRGHVRLPLPFGWFLEAWLYSRWILCGAWLSTWHCVRHLGAEVQSREGISIPRQTWRVLRLSLATCLPASTIYQFRLYRDPKRVWDYVYAHELPAFHHWRNKALGERPESIMLLQDKCKLGERLRAEGIPLTETLAVVTCGDQIDFSPYLDRYPRLFCKPRHGSGAKHAFYVEKSGNGSSPLIHTFEGETISFPATGELLHRHLTQDDYLVEPYLENHPALAMLTDSGEAVTIRLITEHTNTKCYSAVIEIPVRSRKQGISEQQIYVILPINMESGVIESIPENKRPLKPLAAHQIVTEKIQGKPLPYWQELRASALAAHRLFPDIFAIAWDFVVTPAGPRLLEGNAGWATAMPQILHGGLLTTLSAEMSLRP